jgi:hypothetical protein
MNGWIRSAIVLSVAWAIAVFSYVRSIDTQVAMEHSRMVYASCSKAKATGKGYANRNCLAEAHDISPMIDPGPGKAAIAALAPVPFIWLIGSIAFLLVRFALRGVKRAA